MRALAAPLSRNIRAASRASVRLISGTAAAQQSFTRYTNSHEYLNLSASPDDSWYSVDIGITEYGCELIGEVSAVRTAVPSWVDLRRLPLVWGGGREPSIAAGAALIRLDWDGLRMTQADELYHSVWSNVKGFREISSPVDGKLVEVNPEVLDQPDKAAEGTWVVRMKTRAESLPMKELLSAEQYADLVDEL